MFCRILAAVAACLLLASPVLAEKPTPQVTSPGRVWVEVHRETGLWSGPDERAQLFGLAQPGSRFKVVEPQKASRLHVKDAQTHDFAYVDAADVGPSERPPAESRRQESTPAQHLIWAGTARVTMYSCHELGGCNRTALGIYPYEGVVAVDPRLIPLGSTVWLEGLGSFLAADTGSGVRGSHIDVYVQSYGRARDWGVQYLQAAAYSPGEQPQPAPRRRK